MSAADIIQRPSAGLEVLGNSLPKMVGYFISLLVTKILAGLPMVILRVGALGRYLILRMIYRTKYLTQRELENVYCVELRKRNQENIVSLTKRRQLEQQLSTQFPEENAEVVETVKPAPTFKTINLNGSCISVPEGTSLQLDTDGCLTINL